MPSRLWPRLPRITAWRPIASWCKRDRTACRPERLRRRSGFPPTRSPFTSTACGRRGWSRCGVQARAKETHQDSRLKELRHETHACARGRQRPAALDRLLFGAVRHATRRGQGRLCEMDVGRPAGELRDLDPRQAAGPRSSRHPGRKQGRAGRCLCASAPSRRNDRRARANDVLLCPIRKILDQRSRGNFLGDILHHRREHRLRGERGKRPARGARQGVLRPANRTGGAGSIDVLHDVRAAMSDHPFNVLFLCTGNSARSIMAEAILNKVGAGKFRAYSAGSQPKGRVHPHTMQLLASLGYDTTRFRSKSWNEFAKPGAPALDFVFTVCDNAAGETCHVWPGQPMTAHWGIPDPAEAKGTPAEVALAFKEAYRMLFQRIGAFTALPIRSLDQLTLQGRLKEIGRPDGATAKAAE